MQYLSQKIKEQYFPSFEALDADMESRIGGSVLDQNLSPATMSAIAIIYLVWSGFGRNTIPLIRKSALGTSNSIYDPIANVTRAVPEKAMRFLRMYADAPVYMSLVNKTPFLVRSKLSKQISYINITNVICGFNSTYSIEEKPYMLTAIFESGVFSRAADMIAGGTKLPIYHQNYPLSKDGMLVYERIFDRKFSSKDILTRYLVRFYEFCHCFQIAKNPPR